MSRSFTETDDYFDFAVEGDTVSRLSIDYAFTVLLQDTDLQVAVEQKFTYSSGAGSDVLATPHRVAPALEILHKPVRSLRAFKTGRLMFEVNPDITISVEPNPNYEAWNITGRSGVMIVCMPGGKLAVWSGSEDAEP